MPGVLARWFGAFRREQAAWRTDPVLAPHIVAVTDLNRRARRAYAESKRVNTTAALRAGNAAGHTVPLAPREQVVADITARRATTKGE